MIDFYEVEDDSAVNGKVVGIGTNPLGYILVIEDVEKKSRRFFHVVKDGETLTKSDLETEFKMGDFIVVSDGNLQKSTRLIYDIEEE